ncbi:hypothetical protein DN523_21455 [Burkholderia multivorans]|uniref:hypothetical protein n=1 Tax=Burkholderia multivorans TaxID=87883 RepID=UPI000DAEC750|nr:hypothetical protein [Burkholderia multivorans]MBR8044537.1 hypothetical protein [Burkholderia multivorans]MBU9203031.1 hypothetical protein [Burkholderia multivorans]MBU9662290.1 hypothetical protein [Burkholderia multivorans]MCO8355680.1 hypothetical protein [Burkholderia multivorans]MCO8388034.1 hypothetical protein [Burkholderia multivorans]
MSNDRPAFDAYLKSLSSQEAHIREIEDALGEGARNLFKQAELLREGYISLATLARHMAYESVGCPKRLLTPDEDIAYYSVFRQCIRQAKIAVRAGTLTLREQYMLLPVDISHLRPWLDTDETMQSIDAMIDKRYVVRISEARAWLLASGARIPGVLRESALVKRTGESRQDAESQPKNAPPSIRTTGRQVRWREAIVANWPNIVRECGDNPDARTVMRSLKTHDVTGYILPQGRTDELSWRTQFGECKTVSLKTFKNALSVLRKHGFLKS